MTLTTEQKKLQAFLQNSRHGVFFGGAGVSTLSGIPDFRSPGGVYQTDGEAERKLSIHYLLNQPDDFWPFYRRLFMAPNRGPNVVHRYVARLEEAGLFDGVITQNVDGLHQAAGSRQVVELHGNVSRYPCLTPDCSYVASFAEIEAMDVVPRCPACQGRLRPDIVLYGEALDEAAIVAAVRLIERARLILVGGTSLSVYPAAGLLHYRSSGARLVVLNRAPTAFDQTADLCLYGDLDRLLPPLD